MLQPASLDSGWVRELNSRFSQVYNRKGRNVTTTFYDVDVRLKKNDVVFNV